MKAYVKPELFYESFELSQHIAVCGIDVDVNNADQYTCAYLDPDFWGERSKVFSDKSTCETLSNTLECYCYTVGTDEKGRLFNS